MAMLCMNSPQQVLSTNSRAFRISSTRKREKKEGGELVAQQLKNHNNRPLQAVRFVSAE
jgi:hypothetical protein